MIVCLITEHLGLHEQLQKIPGFLDNMISDIELARKVEDDENFDGNASEDQVGEGAAQSEPELEPEPEPEPEPELDGQVSYDEFLPWFMDAGRSYLPRREYPAEKDLNELTEEDRIALFKLIDDDVSGHCNVDEVHKGAVTVWPFLGEASTKMAFEAADLDGSGNIFYDDPGRGSFVNLLSALFFLNRHRHIVEEVRLQFLDGVGIDEFHLGSTILGMDLDAVETDTQFVLWQEKLKAQGKLSRNNKLTAEQFLTWACRHVSVVLVDAEEIELRRSVWKNLEMASLKKASGGLFFEDVTDVLYMDMKGAANPTKKSKNAMAMMKAQKEVQARVALMKIAFADALSRIDSFPGITDSVMEILALASEPSSFFSGQNIITQGEQETFFVIIRKGRAVVTLDGVIVADLGPGCGTGELGLLFGTRRNATITCIGPCDALILDRASYHTAIATLPESERAGPFEKILLKFWALVSRR